MILNDLYDKKLIQPPKFLLSNTFYLVRAGSQMYGANQPGSSDTDIQGFAIPPVEETFPHLVGHVDGFGKQRKRFEQYQQHHIKDGSDEYDIEISSIVKFFHLAMECNPTKLEVLWAPVNCIVHNTEIGQLVRDNRRLFLHKGVYHRMRGYAYSQLHKMDNQSKLVEKARKIEQENGIPYNTTLETLQQIYLPLSVREELERLYTEGLSGTEGSRRFYGRKEWGVDLKFVYHCYRLLGLARQCLETGDMDLQRDKEIYKAIRRGEWSFGDVKEWFSNEEVVLQRVYDDCKILPYGPDEPKIKALLFKCLESHYGSLANCVVQTGVAEAKLLRIKEICDE